MSAACTTWYNSTITICTHKPKPVAMGNICYGAVATGRKGKLCFIGEHDKAVKQEVMRSGHMRKKYWGSSSCDIIVDFWWSVCTCDLSLHHNLLVSFSLVTSCPSCLPCVFSFPFFSILSLWCGENIMTVKKRRNYVYKVFDKNYSSVLIQ